MRSCSVRFDDLLQSTISKVNKIRATAMTVPMLHNAILTSLRIIVCTPANTKRNQEPQIGFRKRHLGLPDSLDRCWERMRANRANRAQRSNPAAEDYSLEVGGHRTAHSYMRIAPSTS